MFYLFILLSVFLVLLPNTDTIKEKIKDCKE